MDYQKIYTRIVERAQTRDFGGETYFEKHHVVPRCMRGTNDPSNIVNLTAEEHYVAHQLLVKIHPGHIGVAMALRAMTIGRTNGQRNNKEYGWVRKTAAAASSKRMLAHNPNADGSCSRKYHAKYRHKHGRNKPGPTISMDGKERIRESKMGDKNPMSGKKPWDNPRATNYSKSVWSKAAMLHNLWIDNEQPSYGRLYNLCNGECFTKSGGGVIAPYMSIVKYFRSGWCPPDDPHFVEWLFRQA